MKTFTTLFFAFILSNNSLAAEPIYLECKVPSLTTELLITLNQTSGKVTQTYKANGSGFTSDAQFNADEIIYEKKIASLGQTERYTINRKTLAINHAIFTSGNGVATVNKDGTCIIVKTENNKI